MPHVYINPFEHVQRQKSCNSSLEIYIFTFMLQGYTLRLSQACIYPTAPFSEKKHFAFCLLDLLHYNIYTLVNIVCSVSIFSSKKNYFLKFLNNTHCVFCLTYEYLFLKILIIISLSFFFFKN